MAKVRDPYALHAKRRNGGPMHHKNRPKGGSKNEMRDLSDEVKDESEHLDENDVKRLLDEDD